MSCPIDNSQDKKKSMFFWGMRLSSQFPFCSLPFVLDTYKDCNHWCKYCFAAINNTVNKSWNKDFFWDFSKTLSLKNFEKIFFNKAWNKVDKKLSKLIEEKVPLHIWWNTDPFSFFEKEQKISLEVLKLLYEHQYPFVLSTKSKLLLQEPYFTYITWNKNAKIQVSLISLDEDKLRQLEPWVSVKDRLEVIETLSKAWVDVIVRCQPYMLWLSDIDIENYIKTIATKWAYSMTIEFLKLTTFMTEDVKKLYTDTSEVVWYDVIDFYKKNGRSTWSDLELDPKIKFKHIFNIKRLCKKYWIKLYVADNEMRSMGDGPICCGFEPTPWTPFENVLKENTSYALYFAKNAPDKLVRFTDIFKWWDFLKRNMMLERLNAWNKASYRKKKDKDFFFSILRAWNTLKDTKNPSRFFYDLKVDWVDECWMLIYRHIEIDESNIDNYDYKKNYEENKKIVKSFWDKVKKFEYKDKLEEFEEFYKNFYK